MANDLGKSLVELVHDALVEIKGDNERSRRSYALRRHKIFRDGGREFLIEALKTEFDVQSIVEFRLCPINFLKKIVKKKAQIYKTPPVRKTVDGLQSDQDLIDFYTHELAFDLTMAKANEYYNLHSNTALYTFPKDDFLSFKVVPPHLYSIVPDTYDKSRVKLWAFNNFSEEHDVIAEDDLSAATGREGFLRDRTASSPNVVDSMERVSGEKRRFILWSDSYHATFTSKGSILRLDPEKGDEQFTNPISVAPVVHLQKDTDNEAWAEQGEDAVDISLLLQRMWTDLATIIKHQGFGQLVVSSEDVPQRIKLGINKTLWMRRIEGKEPPSIQYLTSDSRISEIKETMRDLLFLLLTTNDINPSSVGRPDGGSSFTSGIQALLEMSEALDVMKADQPVHRDAEKQVWQHIKLWHNFMFDMGLLRDDARKLGKFSDGFDISLIYSDIKPVETERDRLELVEKGRDLRLITKKDALKKLNPDMTDEEIEQKLLELEEEKNATMEQFNMPTPPQFQQQDEEAVERSGEEG